MRRSPRNAQRLSLIVFSLHSQHNPVDAPVQGIIAPICGRGVFAANH